MQQAARTPDKAAFRTVDGTLSHRQLADAAIAIARRLQTLDAGPDTIVAIRTDDILIHMATLFATALVGCRWTVARKSAELMQKISPDILLDSEPDSSQRLAGATLLDAHWIMAGKTNAPKLPFPGHRKARDTWMISRTSGTTGVPKFAEISYGAAAHRNAANADIFVRSGMRIAGLFPMSAATPMGRYLSALLYGAEIVLAADPEEWVALDVDYLFGSPAQVGNIMRGRVLSRKLPRLHLSGQTAHETVVRDLLKSFEKITNGYGSVEGYNCLSIEQTLRPDGTIRKETIVRETEFELVDEDDQRVPSGEQGIVRICNSRLASGYLNEPELTAEIFRDGWFYPGDLARWTPEGNFEVVGRINDQFNIGGVKINAMLIDHAMQQVDGVTDAISFMLPREDGPDRLCALVATDRTHGEVELDLRLRLLSVGGKEAVPERYFYTWEMPRTDTGKPDRQACAAFVVGLRNARRAARQK
ncbi:MAG: class I adenylate-forming enzyme family protein [Yoonia sp.]|uniref:class I adenylate-forming enzyme family protein n=1 Tax=Yoonia sp. TaxID=2212373 RepID=UPI003EF50988